MWEGRSFVKDRYLGQFPTFPQATTITAIFNDFDLI